MGITRINLGFEPGGFDYQAVAFPMGDGVAVAFGKKFLRIARFIPYVHAADFGVCFVYYE
jgi:hypothetical protein